MKKAKTHKRKVYSTGSVGTVCGAEYQMQNTVRTAEKWDDVTCGSCLNLKGKKLSNVPRATRREPGTLGVQA